MVQKTVDMGAADGGAEAPAEGAYPPGFEPELDGEELELAIRKEKGYRRLVWFELLFLAAVVAFVVYSIVTS